MFKKFPDIGEFRKVIRTVTSQHDYKGRDENDKAIYRHDTPYPKLRFQGSVKLHGTNAAIGLDENGELWVQSRNQIITPEMDNEGFAKFIHALPENFLQNDIGQKGMILFGEWCGKGINKGTGIHELDKMFVIFNVYDNGKWILTPGREFRDDELEYLADMNSQGIYIIQQFQTYEIEIDFNDPALSQNKLAELTQQVGDQCPVAKAFEVDGIGEGIVWVCVTEGYETSDHWFKVKDPRHQVSKVKTLAPVDVEKVNSVKEFVDNTVTENRLEQGLAYLKEMHIPLEIESTGDFLRWIFNDIIKEESDTLEGNGLTRRDIGGPISRKAKVFWNQKLDEEVGLC